MMRSQAPRRDMTRRIAFLLSVPASFLLSGITPAHAAPPCCNVEADDAGGIVWSGSESRMSLKELASLCGPILWFSPDEPLLHDEHGMAIDIPQNFPFEPNAGTPVVYYRLRTILGQFDDKATVYRAAADRNESVLDLSHVSGLDLDYFFYYPSEEGFGGHQHDVESIQMRISIETHPECESCRHVIRIKRVIGKAHGVLWFDNTLEVDKYTRFPMTILVEEGKHASCTDKNSDGYYTPGYDVNRRANDAWGVRDIIRGGSLFSGGFESWFAKVRVPADRVFPPLPEGNPLRERYSRNGVYAPDNRKYEVRPFPHPDKVVDDDALVPFIADKGDPGWPELVGDTDLHSLGRWLDEESFVKSTSFALRIDAGRIKDDGRAVPTFGLSILFPLFIVKNFEDPVAGGWLVNRVYFQDKKWRDFSWNILYTTSASRWIDGYFALGLEWDDDGTHTRTDIMTETGLKFRANIRHTPVGFLSTLTDFWGVRFGVKNVGGLNWQRIGYTFEIGAGTW